MKTLNETQKNVAKDQIPIYSKDQHYFFVSKNEALHERDVILLFKGQINKMIDQEILIPFVPYHDL